MSEESEQRCLERREGVRRRRMQEDYVTDTSPDQVMKGNSVVAAV